MVSTATILESFGMIPDIVRGIILRTHIPPCSSVRFFEKGKTHFDLMLSFKETLNLVAISTSVMATVDPGG